MARLNVSQQSGGKLGSFSASRSIRTPAHLCSPALLDCHVSAETQADEKQEGKKKKNLDDN